MHIFCHACESRSLHATSSTAASHAEMESQTIFLLVPTFYRCLRNIYIRSAFVMMSWDGNHHQCNDNWWMADNKLICVAINCVCVLCVAVPLQNQSSITRCKMYALVIMICNNLYADYAYDARMGGLYTCETALPMIPPA